MTKNKLVSKSSLKYLRRSKREGKLKYWFRMSDLADHCREDNLVQKVGQIQEEVDLSLSEDPKPRIRTPALVRPEIYKGTKLLLGHNWVKKF